MRQIKTQKVLSKWGMLQEDIQNVQAVLAVRVIASLDAASNVKEDPPALQAHKVKMESMA